MKYFMIFRDSNNNKMLSSTVNFNGDPLNIPELKQRFNTNFVKGDATTVEISFIENNIVKSFIAGFRGTDVIIIDTKTKQEYTPAQFSQGLNELTSVFKQLN